MSEQPNALRLAKSLDAMPSSGYALPNQAAAELRRLHEEVNEQARLLGMSAERELALLAKIDRLERQLGEAVWNYGEKVRANQELLEALKLALGALENLPEMCGIEEAITAVQEALAEQPAQGCEFCSHPLYAGTKCKHCGKPAQQDIPKIGCVNHDCDKCKAQQQEPVAVVKALPMGHNQTDMHYAECQHLPVGTLLYTSPPASKPWVGLTEKEHTDIAIQCGCMSADWVFYGATVERILKEKNS